MFTILSVTLTISPFTLILMQMSKWALVCGYNIPRLIFTVFCCCRPETFSSRSLICFSSSRICLSFSFSCNCCTISVAKHWYIILLQSHQQKLCSWHALNLLSYRHYLSPTAFIPSAIFINSCATLWISCPWCIMQPLPSIILNSSSHPYNFIAMIQCLIFTILSVTLTIPTGTIVFLQMSVLFYFNDSF